MRTIVIPPFDFSVTDGPEWEPCELSSPDCRFRRGDVCDVTRNDEQYEVVVMKDTVVGEATQARCRLIREK